MGNLLDDLIAKGKTFDFDGAFRDFFGLDKKQDKAPEIAEMVQELRTLTTDDDEDTVLLRSVVVWRTLVKHVKSGGTVKLIGPGTEVRTLKVRLR
jgi:hypothetical protein